MRIQYIVLLLSPLDLPRTAFQMSGAMSAAVGGGGVLMVVLVLFMIAVRQRCAKRKPRSAPPPSSQPASPDKLREKDDSESDDRNPDIIPSDTDQMQVITEIVLNIFTRKIIEGLISQLTCIYWTMTSHTVQLMHENIEEHTPILTKVGK